MRKWLLDLTPPSGLLLAAAGLAFVACSGGGSDDKGGTGSPDGDADTDADADSDTDLPCEASISSVTPENGAVGVPFDSEVTVTFDQAIHPTDPWSLEVSNATGTPTLATDGLSATWTGTLEPDVAYTINASVCDDSGTSTFHTSPPPLDLVSLEGNTYAIRWEDVAITEPGNDKALKLLIDVQFVLAQIATVDVAAQTADSVSTIGSDDGSGNAVPVCELAVEQLADFGLNPFFSIEGDMTIIVNATTGATADIEDFSILGQMQADGSAITDVQISGLVATEQFVDGEDCHSLLVQALFPTCVPCTTSATGECMLIEGAADVANLQPGLDIATQCGIGGTTTTGGTTTGTGTTTTP